VLYTPALHEPLVDLDWDDEDVRTRIRDSVALTESAAHPDELWPADEWDLYGSTPPLTSLYCGAAGVVWALDSLRRSGLADVQLDLVALSRRGFELARERIDVAEDDTSMPSRPRSGFLVGETGVVLVAWLLAPDGELADRLHELVVANVRNETNELMWGAPGTMLVARLMHARTGEGRWLETWNESARVLRERLEPDGLWTQDLYGDRLQFLGPAHGWAGDALALLQGGEDTELVDGLRDVARRTAVVEEGLANWPPVVAEGLDPRGQGIRVQWCHGSPGIVTSLSTVLDEELLVAGGELVWQAGPLGDEKGAGLCHGTSGNGFAFLKLFDRTGDELWLDRARRFALHALVQAEHLPPRYSLWTGGIGAALFAARCLDGRADVPTIDTWE